MAFAKLTLRDILEYKRHARRTHTYTHAHTTVREYSIRRDTANTIVYAAFIVLSD